MSKEIVDYLEDLIPDREIAQMVVENADFQIARIDFNAAPRKMWYRIISEAKKYKNGILRILKSALKEMPGDDFLQKEIDNLTSNSPKITTIERDISGASNVLDKNELKVLIGKGKFQQVLDKLNQHMDQLDPGQQNELTMWTNRHNNLAKETRIGIKLTPEKNQEKNTLTLSLLQFIDSL